MSKNTKIPFLKDIENYDDSIKNQGLKESSNKIRQILHKNKASLSSLRSLLNDGQTLARPQRQKSFDKIISKFEINKIKQNLQGQNTKRYQLNLEQLKTKRQSARKIINLLSTNQSIYTERGKNQSKMSALPQIKEVRPKQKIHEQVQLEEDYETFQTSNKTNSPNNKQLIPLGLFKIGKLKNRNSSMIGCIF